MLGAVGIGEVRARVRPRCWRRAPANWRSARLFRRAACGDSAAMRSALRCSLGGRPRRRRRRACTRPRCAAPRRRRARALRAAARAARSGRRPARSDLQLGRRHREAELGDRHAEAAAVRRRCGGRSRRRSRARRRCRRRRCCATSGRSQASIACSAGATRPPRGSRAARASSKRKLRELLDVAARRELAARRRATTTRTRAPACRRARAGASKCARSSRHIATDDRVELARVAQRHAARCRRRRGLEPHVRHRRTATRSAISPAWRPSAFTTSAQRLISLPTKRPKSSPQRFGRLGAQAGPGGLQLVACRAPCASRSASRSISSRGVPLGAHRPYQVATW